LWFRRQGLSLRLVLAANAAILLSPPLLAVAFFAHSEPVFICCLLWFLYQMEFYLEGGGRTAFVLAVTFAALSFLARYGGLTAILTGIVLLSCRRERPWLCRLFLAGMFGAISVLPTVGWCLRNRALTGTLMGERSASAHTLAQNLAASADV